MNWGWPANTAWTKPLPPAPWGSEQAFDREWTGRTARPGHAGAPWPALRQLLGGEAAILDASGKTAGA
jgi:hypothetical protein